MIPKSPSATSKKEPTIALINIVFLMLIFFMIAGTLAPPLDQSVSLVRTTELEGREPPDTLVIRADGSLWLRGVPKASIVDFLSTLEEEAKSTIRIVPDRDLPAKQLMIHTRNLRENGAQRVLIVTERALQ
ncbi:biopolymer transporter ExbD [Shimia sp. R10_1]|uniref:ExbD/TolR family protein n=1 Tax=Shimia sp. R10_1 TaxID=2821095 RepID=UPI001ADC2C91|nr:biopolymer transporter ExbD [Shimia sp. R10_1]